MEPASSRGGDPCPWIESHVRTTPGDFGPSDLCHHWPFESLGTGSLPFFEFTSSQILAISEWFSPAQSWPHSPLKVQELRWVTTSWRRHAAPPKAMLCNVNQVSVCLSMDLYILYIQPSSTGWHSWVTGSSSEEPQITKARAKFSGWVKSPVLAEDGSKLCLHFLETLRWDLIEECTRTPGNGGDKRYQAAATWARFRNNRMSTWDHRRLWQGWQKAREMTWSRDKWGCG